MSTITQRIPNFLLGISQQPDNRKFPGQLKDSVNAFPDYALGLLKRPGGQYVTELYNASTSGKWFSILRDAQEKYVAQYDDNTFRIWSLTDGSPRRVNMGSDTGVPSGCNQSNLQTDLTAYNTAVADTAAKLTLLNTAQSEYAEKLAGQKATTEALFTVNYNYPVGDIEQYLTSGILKDADGDYIVKNADTVVSTSSTLPTGYSLGTELTDEHPLLASSGYRVFQAIRTVAAVNPDTLTITAAGSGLTDGTYTDLETATDGNGEGLTVDIVVSGGSVTSATINQQGTQWTEPVPTKRYDDGDEITLTDSTYSGVTFDYQSDVQEKYTAMTTAQTNYDNAVTAEGTAKTNYDAEVTACVIADSDVPSDAYLKDATADDIELLTLNDYTFVLNKAKTVALKTATSSAKPNEAFVVIKVVGTGHYKIFLDGTERATYNSGSGGDADAIVADLVSDINGNTFGGTTYTAVAVGPGLYISADNAFTISVVGAPSEAAMFAFQEATPTVADLPLQCKDGYVVKVVNSIDIDVDDMYVKFVTDGTATYGVGVWEETIAPGIKYEFDPLTMPHQLVRQSDGSFTYGPVTWEDRIVGDETTNPDPSFVGQKINNLFFYRNRLGFLSNEAVVLSRAGDYINFWVTTALTVTDDDPIDITASSVRPVNHRYVRPSSVGLVLFSDTEQFILTTDADILSPKTAKINELSSYECDADVEAVNLGTTLAFVSKTPLFTRMYELAEISTDKPPVMTEQTKIIPELIPESVDSMIASPALSLVSLGTTGDATVFQYKFLEQPGQGRAAAWYKWELTGTLLDQFFDANTYYAVVKDGSNVFVQSYDLTQANEEGFLTLPTGEKTDICLDIWNINPRRSYTASTDKTRIHLPYDKISDKTFTVMVLGGFIGESNSSSSESVGAILYPTVAGSAGAYYVDVDGDYRGRDLIIGYLYTMEVTLPEFFVTSAEGNSAVADTTSDLIIHRVKVSTGLSGPVKYNITITGRPEWNNTIESVAPYDYELNNVNMSASATHTVPIYQRNENLTLKIIGDTPFPVSLLSLNWEGKYNTGFYKR